MRHTLDGAYGIHPAVEAGTAHYHTQSKDRMLVEKKKSISDFQMCTLCLVTNTKYYKSFTLSHLQLRSQVQHEGYVIICTILVN